MAAKKEINKIQDLPYYREEYTAQLADLGIKELDELLEALKDKDRKKVIVDDLDGVGNKIADHWLELLSETEAETEIVDEEEKTVVKVKPVLNDEIKAALEFRSAKNDARPAFKRQEWFRYQRLGEMWRKPRGIHSKMRRHLSYRPPVVSIGFRGPKMVRDYHPSGFQEVMVYNPGQVEAVDPKVQAIRIGGTVGGKKRMAIIEKADELSIRVLNRT
ncbi:MAG TPA: 50S ribosomal protein L32e [Methanomassiliicoccales archaeon]|nr:50S ribosomal protein L32e [Methanomassiliicoccales archaeon]HNX47082.1 50S ribosomal protein L32e [Methanomassiliicoccales archaeon]HPR97858.1 50S ribosomal protein L32e [Methanomassiliicoccales archaeon]HSA34928.1 50S ribosomal protein L32e [Methanomassiliicoccales archaeon]